jgi:hypothetical protein
MHLASYIFLFLFFSFLFDNLLLTSCVLCLLLIKVSHAMWRMHIPVVPC